jgi:hypothetical protein
MRSSRSASSVTRRCSRSTAVLAPSCTCRAAYRLSRARARRASMKHAKLCMNVHEYAIGLRPLFGM